MKSKRTALLVVATLFILALSAVAILTSVRLRQIGTTSVAPNAPESKPLAGDNQACEVDADCPSGLYCYQPPMPDCPDGADCTQVMPDKYCSTTPNKPGEPGDEANPVCQLTFSVTPATKPILACTTKDAYKTSISTANKLAAGAEVARGDTIVYQINYENTGDAAGTITIVDQLSDKLEFVSADTPCTYAATNRTVTCTDIPVAAGATGSKKITVKVLSTAAAGTFNNSAVVTPSAGEASTCAIGLELKVSTSTPTPTPTPTPTGTPTVLKCNDYCANTSDCPSGYTCSWNKCRNAECPDDNDCSCAKPPGCNEACNPTNPTNECVGGYICDSGTNSCRNSSCIGETDCTCAVAGTITGPQSLPQAGSPVPGFLFLGAGAILLVLGVLVVGL